MIALLHLFIFMKIKYKNITLICLGEIIIHTKKYRMVCVVENNTTVLNCKTSIADTLMYLLKSRLLDVF